MVRQLRQPDSLRDANTSIEVSLHIEFSTEDLEYFHKKGTLNKLRDYDAWYQEFCTKLPSFQDNVLSFTCIITPQKKVRYDDGFQKNNPYILEVFPKIYHIDQTRNLEALQNDVFNFYDKESFQKLKDNQCTFDATRTCLFISISLSL